MDHEPTLTPQEAGRRIGEPGTVFTALNRSGLLGTGINGRFRLRAIEEYEKFGTQWTGEDRLPSLRPDIFDLIGVPPGILGGEQPTDTGTQLQIANAKDSFADNDTSWIAQFYLRPNRHFQPSPTALSLIGPVLIRLEVARDVVGAALPTRLFPDPQGYLAMVQVRGDGLPQDGGFQAAYDVASPVLDQLAVVHDVPLHVCQTVLIGVPSGVITLVLGKPPKLALISATDPLPDALPRSELREAVALYRNAISSDDPFHRFLGLYKTYENCCAIRGEWRRQTRRPVVVLQTEVFPSAYAFQGFVGLTFDQAKQRLNRAFRVALAHGNVPGGTPATGAEVAAVTSELAIVRYMARITLANVRATIES